MDRSADTAVKKRVILYDPKVLRIPGKSVPIGILTILKNGDTLKTKLFLKGNDRWLKYKLEVDNGSYFNGKITMNETETYKKNDSITIHVYTKKWFLGAKDKWILTQKIPCNYETKIHFISKGDFAKAPGSHVQFGIRTYFDNNMYIDKWASRSGKNLKDFIFKPNGGHISKSKGDLKIFNDPYKIIKDNVKLIAILSKNPAITDTFKIMLDYIAHYKYNVMDDNLNVSVDVFLDSIINEKIMKIKVLDIDRHKSFDYFINVNGGSMTIASYGSSGLDGNSGQDGSDGSNGSDGSTSTNSETDSNGNTTTTTVTGPGGNGGDGTNGGAGSDGGYGHDGGDINICYTPSSKPFLNIIKAVSIGGRGGNGGKGGKGGKGGHGGTGNPSGNSGRDGLDGRSGSEGISGRDGRVVFFTTLIQ